jgi:hypothetical protein
VQPNISVNAHAHIAVQAEPRIIAGLAKRKRRLEKPIRRIEAQPGCMMVLSRFGILR